MGVSAPMAIPRAPPSDLPTPPLTPDDGHDQDGGSVSAISAKQSNAALDFLSTLFPRNALGALTYAKSVSISSPNLGQAVFDGVVLSLPDKPKTLYVDGKNAEHVNLRERYVYTSLHLFLSLRLPFPLGPSHTFTTLHHPILFNPFRLLPLSPDRLTSVLAS